MKHKTDFVLKVNELYHDIEGSEYSDKHPEIFLYEADRWRKLAVFLFSDNHDRRNILDIGSGTGFVPLQIAGLLEEDDLFVCSDLSANILNVCNKNLSDKGFKCKFEYIKLDGNKINLEQNKFDFITLNSVLHHMPDLGFFFEDINRLIKIGGRLVIGHEPNRSFYSNRFLWYNYRVLSMLFTPKYLIASILRKLGLLEVAEKILRRPSNKIACELNRRLLEEGLVNKALTDSQITEIVDIHSPTAGSSPKGRGFDVSFILRNHLPNFELERFETYDYLCRIRAQKGLLERYESMLKRIFPKAGATFFVVLRKVTP